ncbi:hypothetical protein D9619_009443 [Psilocybe cf. subviscida]|uniref:Oxidation resistance protein 1 n=1 Tax=Psilocybe cf. subviscida TaxID=2480587 RepID=A0A8H5FAN1_9AGAR|nr:hypothetical protein D9619_009443 [Psilocybe cf. subviscida]
MPHTTAFDDLASLDPLNPQPTTPPSAGALSNIPLSGNPINPKSDGVAAHQQEIRQHHRAPSTSSQSSDFGAFVSVSEFDDPLSGDVIPDDFDETFEDALVDVQQDTASSRSRSTTRSSNNANPTLSFFDQFASDARERTSATRNVVLDELLLHQDDPMYFLAEAADKNLPKTPATSSTITQQQQQQTPLVATPAPLSLPPPMPLPKSPRHASKPGTPQPLPPPVPKLPPPPGAMASAMSNTSTKTIAALLGPDSQQQAPVLTPNYLDPAFDIHQDVDHSYFSIPSPVPPPLSQDDEHIIDLTPNRTGRPTRTLNPRRSQSLVPEPRLAAPVTSPEGALRSLSRSPDISHVLSNDFFTTSPPSVGNPPSQSHPGESIPASSPLSTGMTRSPSSTSLSTLGSLPGAKWMSTLLRASSSDVPQHRQSHPGQARPALESIFSHDEQAQREQEHRQNHAAHSVLSAKHGGGAAEDEEATAQLHTSYQSHGWRQSFAPQHAQTMPTQPVMFSHGSAFAPKPPAAGSSFTSPNYLGTTGVGGGLAAGSYSGMSVTSTASPFAPHIYVPPSGAPGFMGEGYGWDKGFSEELEQEHRREMESDRSSSGRPASSASSTHAPGPVPVQAPGAYLEHASGSGTESGRHLPPRDMVDELSIDPKGRKRRDTNTGLGTSTDFGSFSRAPKAKGTDGGWGSTLFGFGTMRSKTGVFSPPRSSPSPSHDLRGASASEGDLRGSSHRTGEGDSSSGMGDFIERRAGNVELIGRKASSSPVLTSELAGQIRSYLPALSRLPKKWTLVYSLDQDGISLNTLYTRSEAHATRRPAPGEVAANNAAMLLVVKDSDGAIFGAWLAEGIRYIKGGKGYYGGGESFLWKYTNDTLKVFKATGKNKYIALCEPDYISCGGGDGHYGFYLDSSLFDGSSASCPTFDNEPLCSPGPKKGVSVTFECVGLEVWGMGS